MILNYGSEQMLILQMKIKDQPMIPQIIKNGEVELISGNVLETKYHIF